MASSVEIVGDGFDFEDETTFLFTSESVGEGHPGAERHHRLHRVCVGCRF